MASSFNNLGKLQSLSALIITTFSFMKGFSRFKKPAIAKTLLTALQFKIIN